MPAAQLVCALLEEAANAILALDENTQVRLLPLAGKQLRIELAELPWPLLLCFSDKIQMLSPDPASHAASADCTIGLSLATLPALQDNSQLTALIQQQQLRLDGDLHVAQHFSQLAGGLQIDWEEHLSQYLGDAPAHWLMRLFTQAKTSASYHLQTAQRTLADAALEEKNIAAHPLAVQQFSQQVNQLRNDVERIESRIRQMESRGA